MGVVRTCLGHLTLQASKEHSPAVPTEGDPRAHIPEPVTKKQISRVFFWGVVVVVDGGSNPETVKGSQEERVS